MERLRTLRETMAQTNVDGAQQLNEQLSTMTQVEDEMLPGRTIKVGMNSCGCTAFMFTQTEGCQESQRFTLTSVTEMTLSQTTLTCCDVVQGTFDVPCANKNDAKEWIRLIRSLPFPKAGSKYAAATRGVTNAAIGRLDHLNAFIRTYKNHHDDRNNNIFNPIRSDADELALLRLRDMAKEFVLHSKMQESILLKTDPTDKDHGFKMYNHPAHINQHVVEEETKENATTEKQVNDTHLFSLTNNEFTASVRSRLLPHQEFLREHRENIVAKHLHMKSCCCSLLFFLGISSNRLDISLAHKHKRQRHVLIALGIFNCFCGFYIMLFGFCHGPEVTMDWMYRLSLQLILSAFIVRPLVILSTSAILPTLVLSAGQQLLFQHLEKKKAEGQFVDVEMVQITMTSTHVVVDNVDGVESEDEERVAEFEVEV